MKLYRVASSTLLLAFLAIAGGCGGDSAEETTAALETDVADVEPSGVAQRLLPAETIEQAIAEAEDQGLDWAILAAANEIETNGAGAPGGSEGAEQLAAIGFTLSATGAPDDYFAALASRGGEAYANRVLRLADRLRSGPDESSLPETGLPWARPTEGRVVSAFGGRFGSLHNGIDILAETGTPVRATADGVVTSAGFEPRYGNRTCIAHRLEGRERTLSSCYGNQAEIGVEPGQRVGSGDQIGTVGCSGPCLRPHLHLQVLDGGSPVSKAIDPAPFVGIDASDIGSEISLEETG